MKLRIARRTNDLERIETFYTNVLGFDLLGSFENHGNYNGIFIGRLDSDWHFEFTQSNGAANHIYDEGDITVLHPKTIKEYNILINKLLQCNILTMASKNSYWNTNEKMFLDPDEFRIIISNLKAS